MRSQKTFEGIRQRKTEKTTMGCREKLGIHLPCTQKKRVRSSHGPPNKRIDNRIYLMYNTRIKNANSKLYKNSNLILLIFKELHSVLFRVVTANLNIKVV